MNLNTKSFVKKIKNILLRNDGDYFWELRIKTLRASSNLIRLYYQYRYSKLMKEMGSAIPLETIILGKPYLPHGIYGIFISKKAKIGENCTIYQQVTIGSNYVKGSKGYGFPTIGNNVLIGVGAKIIGNVIIGNNVRIGANAVVTKNVPDNSTVIIGDIKILNRVNQ